MEIGISVSPEPQGKPVVGGSGTARFPSRCLCFGEFQLDVQRQELRKSGQPVKVQGKVSQALAALLESPGEIVTREALRIRMWPRDTGLNYDANVNTTVNKLRGLLGDTGEQVKFIETIPRRGYSFVATVKYVDEPQVTPRSEFADQSTEEENGVRSRRPLFSRIFSLDHGRVWFTAGVVALLIAAMLFGAAITLYSHHARF
jgi:DNA-binding winged helix-turn-helix (wHTH) protein